MMGVETAIIGAALLGAAGTAKAGHDAREAARKAEEEARRAAEEARLEAERIALETRPEDEAATIEFGSKAEGQGAKTFSDFLIPRADTATSGLGGSTATSGLGFS